MTDVFVSYKREDEVRVGRLVQALQRHGLSVFWDRGLTGGDQWRASLEAALAQSRSCVVVWTQSSTGAAGDFVKDEAARAARRQILVPVIFQKVDPPLGFGELQAIDLTRWRGSPRDPFLMDLVAAIRAKIEGREAPRPLGPIRRLRRRVTVAGVASVLVALASAFATNTLNLQNGTCGMQRGQPWLSDACGAFGLGARPRRAERIAWEQRPKGECEAIRRHLRQFPEGGYRDMATALLSSRHVAAVEHWTPVKQDLTLYVGRDALPVATEFLARNAAIERGRKSALRLCHGFAASGVFRFHSADVEPEEWMCEPILGGIVCGFDGKALCSLEGVSAVERESCDEQSPK